MCVIFVADKEVRPTDEMIRFGWADNSHGGGVAWREGGEVHYSKGLTLDQVLELNAKVPFPYVVHLRKASPGTAEGPYGTQPFPVADDASYALSGVAPDGVLFHNGYWADWKGKLLEYAIRGGWKLPDGPWTDSRGLAIMARHVGGGALEFISEKVIWFTIDAIKIYGNGVTEDNRWVEINDILCSNKRWQPVVTGGGRRGAGFIPTTPASTAATEVCGGAPQEEHFRSRRESSRVASPSTPQGDRTEAIQQGDAETVREGVAEQRPRTAESRGPLLVLPTENLCDDCRTAIAKVHNSGGDKKHRCWDCWEKFSKANGRVSGGAFLDMGSGARAEVVALCQFCWRDQARHVTRKERKPICQVCWLKQGRPDNERLAANDPQARISGVDNGQTH
jgi:hypothetical protein